MSDLIIYDATCDETRKATQADIDRLQTNCLRLGIKHKLAIEVLNLNVTIDKEKLNQIDRIIRNV